MYFSWPSIDIFSADSLPESNLLEDNPERTKQMSGSLSEEDETQKQMFSDLAAGGEDFGQKPGVGIEETRMRLDDERW